MADFYSKYLVAGEQKSFPPVPVGKKISYHEEVHDDGPLDANGVLLVNQIARSYYISYEDADGCESQRIVTIQSVMKSTKGDLSLFGFCHLRKRIRQFRVDRIRELINTDTGEVLEKREEIEVWIGSHFNPFWTDIKTIHPVMICLVYAARVDTNMVDCEWEVMHKFMQRNLGKSYNLESADRYLSNLRPTSGQFTLAWNSITGTDQEGTVALLLDDIIRADGLITKEEDAMMSGL